VPIQLLPISLLGSTGWRSAFRSGFVILLLAVAFASIARAEPVSDARLKGAAASQDWLLNGRDYANQRFSPLAKINGSNVKKLVPKWIYQTGVVGTFQTTPIVSDGTMYISTPFSHVVAVDAKTGREKWRYEHKRRTEKLFGGPANRGVSIGYGKVYVATVDAHLIALDITSGEKIWDKALVNAEAATEQKDKLNTPSSLAADVVTGSTGVGSVAAPLI